MDRRHLLALGPLATLSACSGAQEAPPPGDRAPSDAGGSPSDGGAQSRGPVEPTEPPEPEIPAEVTSLLEDLSPREIAGQLVMVGITSGHGIDPAALQDHHVGGFFLLSIWRDPAAVTAVVDSAVDLSREDLPPLLAVDQEGGQVRMLRGDAHPQIASAEELGAEGPEAVREAYRTIGESLRDLGLQCALSPVADVVDPELGRANGPVGALQRGFGTDPDHVSDCVEAAVEGLASQDVAATLKHFPGLGGVRENTDHAADGITDERFEQDDDMLVPFAAGIDAGAELVMLSSAVYPRIDAEQPAMHSRAVVTGMLREDLGFTGVAITDDIGAAKAIAHVPVPERATRFLDAGGDVVITADPSLAGQLVDAIEEWAAQDDAQGEHVRAAAERVLLLKHGLGLLGG